MNSTTSHFLNNESVTSPESLRPRAFPTIVLGGLIVSVLDAIDALVAFGLMGSTPLQVYQFVASGWFGPSAFQGGWPMALAGVGFHCFIAFAVAAVFYAIIRLFPVPVRLLIPAGLAFGVGVFLVMNFLVLPFSLAPKSPFYLPLFLNGVIGHALLVGLPVGWMARRSLKTS